MDMDSCNFDNNYCVLVRLLGCNLLLMACLYCLWSHAVWCGCGCKIIEPLVQWAERARAVQVENHSTLVW